MDGSSWPWQPSLKPELFSCLRTYMTLVLLLPLLTILSVTSPSSFSTYPLVRAFQCFNCGLFILFTTYSLKGMFLRLQLYTNLSRPDFSSLSIMFQTTYAKCSKYVATCPLPVYFFKGTRFTCFAEYFFFFTQHGSLLHFICFYWLIKIYVSVSCWKPFSLKTRFLWQVLWQRAMV